MTNQDNGQFSRFNPNTFSLEQLSISEVEIRGVELEAWWQPTESIDVQLGLGMLDNEIVGFDPTAFDLPPVGIIGNTMPRVADWNASLAVTYTRPLASGSDFVARVAGNWLGERNFDLENTLSDSGAAYVNASIGLEADVWTAQLRVSNLADQFEPEDAFPGIASPVAVFRNRPRQVTAELIYRF